MLHTKRSFPETTSLGVIGLGYVGLPLALGFAGCGFQVTGIDTNLRKVEQLNKGYSYLPSVDEQYISRLKDKGRFHATINFESVKQLDTIILCLPTPITSEQIPDLQLLKKSVKNLIPYLKKEVLIILESTVYPGATEEIIEGTLLNYGLKAGRDYHLCYSPERVDPGNKEYTLANTPKVLAGKTAECLELGKRLYQNLTEVVEVSSIQVAEMSKLLENTYRSVNIGFINEMAKIAEGMSINIWEVIDAAATKPYGFQKFTPGPGVGGHCIPVDPHYLNWKAGHFGMKSEFIELADRTNRQMPGYIVDKVLDMTIPLHSEKPRVLLLGVSYKPDSDDIREAPGMYIFDKLQELPVEVHYHDPYVEKVSTSQGIYKSWEWNQNELETFDLVCLVTAHSFYKKQKIPEQNISILDTQHMFPGSENVTFFGGDARPQDSVPAPVSTVRL
ncbi:nucleotide sugar dehydrogenase [Salimicrobium sp. PL1-032A]|uniref:nucleotide sugar dehydrogenase n=1 Tax=Salimicrobium sp. PL1-032A TaxID=3095364 RepID=UPI003261BAD4